MEWFDCHAEFGRRVAPSPIQAPDAASLAALYAEIGIQRALVVHAAMRTQHAAVGNARVVEETRHYPQLAPTWAILPPQTGELGDVPDFLAAMAGSGVRALWAFPGGYLLNALTFGPLLEEMVARRIPLFVRVETLGPHPSGWAVIGDLLAAFADLRLVVILPSVWGQDRFFRPLVERYAGFHIATSLYMLEGGVRAFCERYGPRQLLFGTSFPDCQPGGSYFCLLRADIPEEDRTAIAGGNLRRLLEEVTL